MRRLLFGALLGLLATAALGQAQELPTPADVKAASVTAEDVPYPYPTSLFPLTLYWQDLRMSFMDVAAEGVPNGHTVLLLHGSNFAGFYWGEMINRMRKDGFRVVAPDQSGSGRSSKPIMP